MKRPTPARPRPRRKGPVRTVDSIGVRSLDALKKVDFEAEEKKRRDEMIARILNESVRAKIKAENKKEAG